MAECPRGIITQEDDKSFPHVAQADEVNCMACGHCVAVCPYGALSVTGVAIEDCPEIEKDLVLSWDQAKQFLRSRRSIRWFKDKAMDRGTLEALIHTARYAPTASNAQNLHWTVIEGRENLELLSRETINWMERVIEAPTRLSGGRLLPPGGGPLGHRLRRHPAHSPDPHCSKRSQRERQRLGGFEHRPGLSGTGRPAPGRGNLLGRVAPGGHAE